MKRGLGRPVAQRSPDSQWFKIITNAAKPTTAEVWIYDEIGYWGITASDFAQQIASLSVNTIDVRLNSPGGEVFDGVAIHNALANHPATVNIYVDGLAASIASVIAMAGDRVVMGAGSQMMIHDGLTICVGNAADMREAATMLDKTSDTIATFYAARAGGSLTEWRDRMRAETWYTGDEAVAAGLADEVAGAPVIGDDAPVPRNEFDLSVFAWAGRAAAPAPVLAPVLASAATADAYPAVPGDTPDVQTGQSDVAGEPGGAEEDSDTYLAAMSAAMQSAFAGLTLVEPEPVFPVELFRAGMALAANDAPDPYPVAPPPVPDAGDPAQLPPIDLSDFRRALREARI